MCCVNKHYLLRIYVKFSDTFVRDPDICLRRRAGAWLFARLYTKKRATWQRPRAPVRGFDCSPKENDLTLTNWTSGLFLACNAVATAAWAQPESGEGKYRDLLVKALEASAQGHCPADIMGAALRSACEVQSAKMVEMFAKSGKLANAKYMGTQPTANGAAEVYLVSFDNAKMTWLINTGADGKILVLWSGG